jgi:hypothetical protein
MPTFDTIRQYSRGRADRDQPGSLAWTTILMVSARTIG